MVPGHGQRAGQALENTAAIVAYLGQFAVHRQFTADYPRATYFCDRLVAEADAEDRYAAAKLPHQLQQLTCRGWCSGAGRQDNALVTCPLNGLEIQLVISQDLDRSAGQFEIANQIPDKGIDVVNHQKNSCTSLNFPIVMQIFYHGIMRK